MISISLLQVIVECLKKRDIMADSHCLTDTCFTSLPVPFKKFLCDINPLSSFYLSMRLFKITLKFLFSHPQHLCNFSERKLFVCFHSGINSLHRLYYSYETLVSLLFLSIAWMLRLHMSL